MGVDFNMFGKIADMLSEIIPPTTSDIASKAVDNIKARIVANGQVETGEMLDSVHAETQSDGSQNIVIDAKNREGEFYAAYPNYGTIHEPGKPFFEPGLEDTQPVLDTAMQTIAEKIGSMKQ